MNHKKLFGIKERESVFFNKYEAFKVTNDSLSIFESFYKRRNPITIPSFSIFPFLLKNGYYMIVDDYLFIFKLIGKTLIFVDVPYNNVEDVYLDAYSCYSWIDELNGRGKICIASSNKQYIDVLDADFEFDNSYQDNVYLTSGVAFADSSIKCKVMKHKSKIGYRFEYGYIEVFVVCGGFAIVTKDTVDYSHSVACYGIICEKLRQGGVVQLNTGNRTIGNYESKQNMIEVIKVRGD